MFKLTDRQKELFEKIDSDAADTHWRDWKWQLRHQIRDIDTFEELLGVQFEPDERRQLE
jgi:lysine 2,3-aminomutase